MLEKENKNVSEEMLEKDKDKEKLEEKGINLLDDEALELVSGGARKTKRRPR